ncbi:hypothetical protein V5735_23885 (plasmid) [Haladaptatus sp. SPP-AMP-3]|uniref:hypothetical protein n=1 Tax=Haladaptatus sp. SPP-AMP-3 TaxID=3121295 RepID=UPI003C30C138
MQLLESLMHWPPFHRNRICDPPSGHRRKLGHRNAVCKHMAAVENATDDGTLNAFPSETTMPNPTTATALASVTSRAGRVCE